MTKQTGERIGKQLSSVEEVDVPKNGVGWGSSLQVGLSIDVTKPIPRGRLVTFQSLGQMWISFKYERLPWLCFHYSILGHLEKDCVTKLRCGGKNIGETKQYGPWLLVTKFLNHRYGSGGSGEQRNQTTAMVKAHGGEKKNSFLNLPLHHNPNFLGNLISTGVNIQVTDSGDNVSPKQPQHPHDKDIRLETNLQHVGKSKDRVPSSIQSSSKLGTTVVEDNNEKVDVVPNILKDVGTSILSGTSSGDKAKTSKHDTCNEVTSKNMAINGGKKNNFSGKMLWKWLAREKGKTTGVSSEGPKRGATSYKAGLLAPEKKRFKSTDESFNSEFSSSAEAVVQPHQDQ
ncbi:putative leucine-rich repeat receptor-like protein kinase [Fagus crenata]